MHLRTAAIALVYLVCQIIQVSAHIYHKGLVDAPRLYHHNANLERKLQRRASTIIDNEVGLHRRAVASSTSAAPVPSSSPTSTASTMNSTTWKNQTEAACMKALTGLKGVASSPAGVAVCYNVPYYNRTTGFFQVDLRLYQISPASGDWTTLNQQGVSISLNYSGATVSAGKLALRRDISTSTGSLPRDIQSHDLISRSSPPRELSAVDFVGQVNSGMMKQSTNNTVMKTLLTPDVTLSATAKNGTELHTTLSSKQASFVNGVFSDQVANPGQPNAAVPTKFVLPGMRLGIFPTGLIITGAWTVIFLGTIGFGTIGRIRFRNAYRRRKRREMRQASR